MKPRDGNRLDVKSESGYRNLPESVRLEDTIASVDERRIPDSTPGQFVNPHLVCDDD